MSIKFDLVSKLHLFTRTCILASYKAAGVLKPRIIYSSLPKVMSRFYTKRSVLGKVRKKMEGWSEHEKLTGSGSDICISKELNISI